MIASTRRTSTARRRSSTCRNATGSTSSTSSKCQWRATSVVPRAPPTATPHVLAGSAVSTTRGSCFRAMPELGERGAPPPVRFNVSSFSDDYLSTVLALEEMEVVHLTEVPIAFRSFSPRNSHSTPRPWRKSSANPSHSITSARSPPHTGRSANGPQRARDDAQGAGYRGRREGRRVRRPARIGATRRSVGASLYHTLEALGRERVLARFDRALANFPPRSEAALHARRPRALADGHADCDPRLRLAVIGDPVSHSASPQMHDAALAALGVPARYTPLHVRPPELKGLSLLHRSASSASTAPSRTRPPCSPLWTRPTKARAARAE